MEEYENLKAMVKIQIEEDEFDRWAEYFSGYPWLVNTETSSAPWVTKLISSTSRKANDYWQINNECSAIILNKFLFIDNEYLAENCIVSLSCDYLKKWLYMRIRVLLWKKQTE